MNADERGYTRVECWTPIARRCALAVCLVLLTLIVYIPVYSAGLIWDDEYLIFDNPHIHAAGGLYDIWFTARADDYYPLTKTLYWVEWRLFGREVVGYRIINVLLHALSAVIIWRVLWRLDVPGAYVAAALFALHPVCVASAAWIAEGKNTLSLLFFAAATWAYLRFEDGGGRPGWYFTAWLLFLAALLSKASVVMLPVVLLLLAWWRRGRVTRDDIRRTAPFFMVALLFGFVAVYFQHNHAIRGVPRPEGMLPRVVATGWVVWFYALNDLFPFRLAMIYPRWAVDPTRPLHWLPLVGVFILFAIAWARRQTWGRAIIFALGYMVIVLAPVLGLIAMAFHRHSLVADHLQYLAVIAPIALVVASATVWLARRKVDPRVVRTLAAVIVFGTAIVACRQASLYSPPSKLWAHTLSINDRSFAVHFNYAHSLAFEGQLDLAIVHLKEAVRINPRVAKVHRRLAEVYEATGDHAAAESHRATATRLTASGSYPTAAPSGRLQPSRSGSEVNDDP